MVDLPEAAAGWIEAMVVNQTLGIDGLWVSIAYASQDGVRHCTSHVGLLDGVCDDVTAYRFGEDLRTKQFESCLGVVVSS